MKPAAPDAQEQFRVLVIEDDPDVGRVLCSTLNAVNLECFYEPDGATGLISLGINEPHLVLLDLMLPGQSGNDVCAEIRRQSTVPIIMMTALDADDAQLQGFKTGADDYVSKPFNMKLLVARVVANLRRAYRYDSCENSAPNHSEDSVSVVSSSSSPTSIPASVAASLSAALSDAGHASAAPRSAAAVPSGWATCDRCGYMGPRFKFDFENALGQPSLRCPVCKESDYIAFSL